MDTGWIARTNWVDCSPGSAGGLNADSDVQHNLGLPITDLVVQFFFSETGSNDDAVPTPLGWMHRSVDANAIRVFTQSTGPVFQGLGGPEPLEGKTGYYKVVVSPPGGDIPPRERIYYDTVTFGGDRYPLTEGTLHQKNQGNAPRVVGAWWDFADSQWEVRNFTTHLSTIHSFPTRASFVDWKNANVPHGGSPDHFLEAMNLCPFDEIDREIPVMTRMYGVNNLYSGFRGQRSKAGKNSFVVGNYGQGAMLGVWESFFGTGHGWTPATFNRNTPGRAACWTPRAWKQLYSMPKLGEWVETGSSGSSGRNIMNDGAWTFTPLITSDFMTFQSRRIVWVSPSTASWDIWDNFTAGNQRAIQRRFYNTEAGSFFVVYLLRNGGAPYRYSTFWKPLGIDRLWLNYIDASKYELEYVWWNTNDMQPCRFGKVTSFATSPHPSSGQAIDKHAYLPQGRWKYMYHMKYSNRLRIFFRLRDISTGRVGALSPAHVEVVVNQTNAPIKLMVKQNHHGG